MHGHFWLLACGGLNNCGHSCRLGGGRSSGGGHSEGFVEVRSLNNGPQRSRGRVDHGESPAGLSAKTHGNFGLGAAICCPGGDKGSVLNQVFVHFDDIIDRSNNYTDTSTTAEKL